MFEGNFPSSTISNEDGRILALDRAIPRSTRRALSQLMKASDYAADTDRNSWEFALTVGELRRAGVTENELRWLVCRGYIEHANEVMTNGSQRVFNRHASLRFGKQTAFVITSAGIAFSRDVLKYSARSEARDGVATNSFGTRLQRSETQQASGLNGGAHPKWDRDRRELRIGNNVVKVFKLPSPMQETILMAFEEERWPRRIDDPLPRHPDHIPKRRLHDTIKSLNRNQKNCLIRFIGDGTGEGIRWELVVASDRAEPSFANQRSVGASA